MMHRLPGVGADRCRLLASPPQTSSKALAKRALVLELKELPVCRTDGVASLAKRFARYPRLRKERGSSETEQAGMASAAEDTAAAPNKDTAVASEDAKVEVFEDDDEFEEFETEDWDDQVGEKEATQVWEDDWDDDDVSDDFSQQLRAELDRAGDS